MTPERVSPRTTKGAVSRALRNLGRGRLAVTRLDVARRAGLVVLNRARNRVADAVAAGGGDGDLDVLDPGVVGLLQLRQGDARVTGRVVGVERLHARDGGADVGLRGGLVRPRAEAEVRRDRDCQQDPENDDHDQKLDQGETTLIATHLAESVRKAVTHACFLLRGAQMACTLIGRRPLRPPPRSGECDPPLRVPSRKALTLPIAAERSWRRACTQSTICWSRWWRETRRICTSRSVRTLLFGCADAWSRCRTFRR